MSSGTITVTNKSDKVVGVGTAFTTDLKAGDVMVMPVGAGSFTLIVKSIKSATGLTLMEPFRGPTLSGQSWSAVPYETMLRINAQLSTQTGIAIYGLNLDKQNWQAVFSESGDITITLPDLTTFTGPSWKKIADLLESLEPTQVGRDIIGKSTIADILTYLGLKEAAKRDVGTGDKQLPDMSAFTFSRNGNNGWDVLPNGMIRQFGTVTLSPVGNFNQQKLGGVDYYTHYYRVAFPRKFLNAQISTNATLASTAYTVQGSMAGRTLAIHRDTDTGSDVSKTRFVVAYTTPVLGEAPIIHFESIGY